jgi:hypothetical protein
MKTALALFLAAAAFCTASSLGALPLRSSAAAPSAIVLVGGDLGPLAAPQLRSARPAHAVVRRRVEQTRLSAYRGRREPTAGR